MDAHTTRLFEPGLPVVMEPMRVGTAQYVRRNAEMSVIPDPHKEVEAMLVSLESHVMAHKIFVHTEKHLVASDTWEFPASPWQFFKQRHRDRWWMRWLVVRRPVRLDSHHRDYERTVVIGRHVTFPDCSLDFYDAQMGKPVIVDTVEVE